MLLPHSIFTKISEYGDDQFYDIGETVKPISNMRWNFHIAIENGMDILQYQFPIEFFHFEVNGHFKTSSSETLALLRPAIFAKLKSPWASAELPLEGQSS